MVSLCLSALGIFGDIDFTKYIFTSSFRPGSSKEGSENEVERDAINFGIWASS